MKGKRILAALLAAVLLMGSASAVSSFSDIQDEVTAVNADVLRLMGVVNGSGENRFSGRYPDPRPVLRHGHSSAGQGKGSARL